MRDQNTQENLSEAPSNLAPAFQKVIAAIEFCTKVLGFGYLLTLIFGGLLMSVYFFRHSFNPGGISASDALTIALLTFAFVGILAALVVFGAIGCYPWLPVAMAAWRRLETAWKRWRSAEPSGLVMFEWKRRSYGYFSLGIIIDAGIVFLLIKAPLPIALQFCVTFLCFGFFPCIAIFGKPVQVSPWRSGYMPDNPVDRWYQQLPPSLRILFAGSVVTGGLALVALPDLQDLSLKSIGFRKDQVDVRLKKEDYDFLVTQSMIAGSVVNDCEPIISGEFLVRRVDVLWQKFGTQALLRYPAVPIGQPEPAGGLRLEVPNSDFKLVHPNARRRCAEVLGADLFDKAGIKATAAATLQQKLTFLQNLSGGSSVTVRMYSPADTKASMLRTAQGAALRKLLLDTFAVSTVDLILAQGTENRVKWDCDSLPPEITGHCQNANTRIEIALGASEN